MEVGDLQLWMASRGMMEDFRAVGLTAAEALRLAGLQVEGRGRTATVQAPG